MKDEPYNYGIELVSTALKDEKLKLISKKQKTIKPKLHFFSSSLTS